MPGFKKPIREAITHEIDLTIAHLRDLRRPNRAIHGARKAIRRCRSLIDLVRRVVDLDEVDVQLQQLGRDLSKLRDHHVCIRMFQRVPVRLSGNGHHWIIDRLTTKRDSAIDGALVEDPGFSSRRAMLLEVRRKVLAAEWKRISMKKLSAGLKRSSKRIGKALDSLIQRRSADNLHRLRKRSRRLRMQIEAVESLDGAAEVGRPRGMLNAKTLHKLTNAIGRTQDLQLLRAQMREIPEGPGKFDVMSALDHELARSKRRTDKLVSRLDDKI